MVDTFVGGTQRMNTVGREVVMPTYPSSPNVVTGMPFDSSHVEVDVAEVLVGLQQLHKRFTCLAVDIQERKPW